MDEMNIQELGASLPTDPGMAQLEIKKWTGHSDYLNPTGKYHGEISGRVEKLYSIVHPEAPGRQGEQEDMRGIGDTLRKGGLDTPEKIRQEAAEGWGVATQEKFNASVKACETTLKAEWGADYQKNLTFARGFFKEVIIEEVDRAWLDHSHPDGTPALSNDPEFIKAFVSVGKILMENNTKYKDEMTKFIRNYKPTRKGKK